MDTTSDPLHCGGCDNPCPSGGQNSTPICQSSECGFACNAGYSRCGNSCVDTSSNKNHCGQCNKKCVGQRQCVGGQCQ